MVPPDLLAELLAAFPPPAPLSSTDPPRRPSSARTTGAADPPSRADADRPAFGRGRAAGDRTPGAGPCPWACPASCGSAALAWPAATSAAPELTAERFVRTFGRPGRASTAPATSSGRRLPRAEPWSSSAARTSRSRSAASASSRGRSRRRCCAHPGGRGRRWSWRRAKAGRGGWSPTVVPAGERCQALRAARASWRRACRPTWCPRPSSSCPSCRSAPTARWTARACPRPRAAARRSGARRRRTPAEEIVAGIWCEVLRRAAGRPGHADFFELGGHSLLATQVVTRLRAAIGVELPLRELFQAPTVAELAAAVVAALAAGDPGRSRAPHPAGAAGPRPAALLRPGAALVPRPAGAGQRRLQHPARPAVRGELSPRRPWRRRSARWCGATRPAHHLPGRGGGGRCR